MKLPAYLFGALVAGLIVLTIVIPFLNTETQVTYTRFAVSEYGRFREQAEKGDIAEAAAALRNVESFWPIKVPHESRLASVVAASRESTIREIITRMRALSGEDLGNDPELWVKKYYKESSTKTNQQRRVTATQPVSPDPNTTPTNASSNSR